MRGAARTRKRSVGGEPVLLREVSAGLLMVYLCSGLLNDFLTMRLAFLSMFGKTDRCSHLRRTSCYFILCLLFQWQCKADLENTHCFRQIEVSCEGCDYPDDPYILRGSCSLLFRLELTEEGERKVKNFDSFDFVFYQSREDSSDSTAVVIVIIVILVLAYGVYKFFLSNQQPQQTFGDGDGFAHPSWQNHQAPPPPGFEPSFTGGDRSGTWSSHENSSGPGFWTGLGAGGLLGYLAGCHGDQAVSSSIMWTDPAAAAPVYGQSSNSTQGSSTGTRTASAMFG
ncbi:Store-operated calcium entry-associated regulatory factor [Aix galericulata]|nr:Store-operated calcium entry-associated regulatory factor [Aix galericulata]